MTLPLPNLDDRTFVQLVEEARRRIEQTCPAWTDLSPHDPGMTLVEVFAHLTEVLLYRLNRVPEKAYVAFLNLLGVQRHAPVAASVVLQVRRHRFEGALTVAAGTRVTTSRGGGKETPVFVTEEAVTLAPGDDVAEVVAHHCERVEGELVGVGDGTPGQVFTVARAPMTRTTEALDLLVGVEVAADELEHGVPARQWEGRTFRIWEPVGSFAVQPPGAAVYVVDRTEGRITFAPALDAKGPDDPGVPPAVLPRQALAGMVAAGRQVRAWYRTGGGPSGNVAAGVLTTLRDPVPGVALVNPEPARGGRAMESMENLLRRGPSQFLTVRRAVTATDFELLAVQSSGAVARAKALTRADVWSFARPGQVEVVLVPHVPEEAVPGGQVRLDVLVAHQTEQARCTVEDELDRSRPLGTGCVVGWARYKPVGVRARVVVRREEDEGRVRARILDRLNRTICPSPNEMGDGWPFGQALRRSNVYRLLEEAEPGVRWVDSVRFVVEEAPDGPIATLASDRYQPGTWYAGEEETLFRSTNDGDGWEPAENFPGERVWVVTPYPGATRAGVTPRPGLVALATRIADGSGSSVRVSEDLGESWRIVGGLDVGITALAWTSRGAVPELLVATDKGLYEFSLLDDAAPIQVLVDRDDPDRGFYDVESFTDARGEWSVAVAAQAEQGVYLSTEGGQPGSFHRVGLTGEDTRTLAVQLDGPATWLWAGVGEADPDQPGGGAFRARLFEVDVRWEPCQTGWVGGTCWELVFADRFALAATQNGGAVRLDLGARQPRWQPLDVNAGLPLRDQPRFEPVRAVATVASGTVAMAGGPKGVYRSDDEGRTWRSCAHREADEVVTIPDTWLLCSAEHEIEVVTGRAARRD